MKIKLTDMEESPSGIVLHGVTLGRISHCPHCGKASKKVHDYRYRKLQCIEFMSRPVLLILCIRHFRCRNPQCKCHTFSERLNFASAYSRMTQEVADRVLYETLNQSARLACESLSRQGIRVSPSTCTRRAGRLGLENPIDVKTSGYVAIDDLAYRKGHRYMCAIVDHYTRKPLALFGARYGKEIVEWLKLHPEIRMVSRDGSVCYDSIIKEALPLARQVSDRFHLIKNLKETMVDSIRKRLGEPKSPQRHLYPSEEEAYGSICEAIYSMGKASHRTRVKDYLAVRRLQESGMTVIQISRETGLSSKRIYELQKARMDKILNEDQKKSLRGARQLARELSSGCITAATLAGRMGGMMESRLVCRCVRELGRKYREIRKKVRTHNARREVKVVRMRKDTIWKYILTGKTSSRKLCELREMHPEMEEVMQLCSAFIQILMGKDESMELDEWIRKAGKVKDRHMKSFVGYIKSDKEAVAMACHTHFSNGMMEGTVNKIKGIKRSMFNRAGIKLLRAKVLHANYGRGYNLPLN